MTTPNYSDAERELRRVEEIESAKMQDRTRAIVEAAERLLAAAAKLEARDRIATGVEIGEWDELRRGIRAVEEALALPVVPTSKLRAVYDAAERLVARNAEGGSLVEAWEALEAALALPAEPAPAPSAIRSTVERLETLRQLVDLTHQNAVRSLQETSRCVQESLAEIRAELGTPGTGAEPAPAWTRKPPSEPGTYWWRGPARDAETVQVHRSPSAGLVAFRWSRPDSTIDAMGGEWRPVRLQEPPA